VTSRKVNRGESCVRNKHPALSFRNRGGILWQVDIAFCHRWRYIKQLKGFERVSQTLALNHLAEVPISCFIPHFIHFSTAKT
jgi:hypothetical protein